MLHKDNIKWEMVSHLSMCNQYYSLYRDNELGLQSETITNRNDDGSPKGRGSTHYFIDKDDREFTDLDLLVDAYNEKFKLEDENPEHEVKYIRVIVKRK